MGTFGNITSDRRQCAFPGGSTDIQTMALGGTGANLTAIAGGLVYSTATQLAITSALTGIVQGNGAAAPTAFTGTQYGLVYFATASTGGSTAAGTSVEVLHGNATGAPTWGSVALTTDVSGTLPVGNGGSGATTLTGVLYGNGASAFTASVGTANYLPKWSATAPYLTATSLIYDSGTAVGIGTTTPLNTLHVTGTGIRHERFGGTPQIINDRANGTQGSPSIVGLDVVLSIAGRGWDGAAYINAAQIQMVVDQTPGTNDMPGRMTFSTTADGAASVTERMRIDSAGNIGLNTTTFGTSAAKVLAIGNGTAPTTSPADVVQMWSDDRGGTAGKASLHLRTEDGTQHVFGDLCGIGTLTPGASAKLQIDSTTSGFLPPRMTKAQRDAIGTPANGLMLYQTDGTAGVKAYVGGAWVTLNTTADP